jgi:hypothetical protein
LPRHRQAIYDGDRSIDLLKSTLQNNRHCL